MMSAKNDRGQSSEGPPKTTTKSEREGQRAQAMAVADPDPAIARQRWTAAAPMAIIGTICIIAGGLLPAVTASVISRELAWLTAYLVLVLGVAAVALGLGQAFIGAHVPRGTLVYAELIVYFAGNALVITGTFSRFPVLTDVGGGLLALALLGFIWGARGSRGPRTWGLYVYRAIIVILLISIPIGLVLAHLRAG